MRDYSYISEYTLTAYHAGNKARYDVNSILQRLLGKPVLSYPDVEFYKLSILEKAIYLVSFSNIHLFMQEFFLQNNMIFMQYPFVSDPLSRKLLARILQNNKVILLIHDADSFRGLGRNSQEDEIRLFNQSQVLIVHNQHMLNKFKELGIKVPMVSLEVFDYLRPVDKHEIRYLANVIAFAGNLAPGKSEFLSKEIDKIGLSFNLYGPGFHIQDKKNIVYKGSFPPNEIPYRLEGSFGLIWDGDSVQTCSGAFGKYMKYNNPHKLSLYISACLPVITWKKAAIADFVNKHQIGFCVDSLYEIKDKIDSLTKADYQKYLDNLKDLQKKVITGYFTKRAIQKAIEIANE